MYTFRWGDGVLITAGRWIPYALSSQPFTRKR